MNAIATKERLVSDVVRLRKAERDASATARRDIGAVQADLESMIGATVSRALAARLLGVSQTALERWIDTGEIPVLIAPSGRREVPLHALVGLVELVWERRLAKPQDRHPLGSVLRERRIEAARLTASPLLIANDRADSDRSGHRRAELHSLAYHRAVARRLNETIVREAEHRLARWSAQGRIDPRYAGQWREILAQPRPQIGRLIGEDSPQMRDLRQSSPFAGTLSEPERKHAYAAVDEAP